MIQRRFTGYDQPLLPVVLSHLLPDGDSPLLDLSQTVVLVPTRNVVRRLRAGLATRAGEAGHGLLSPKVLTPGSLAEALGGGIDHFRPSPTLDLLLWSGILEEADPASLEPLFGPNPPATPESRFRAARFIRDTRREILEAGLDFHAVLAGGLAPDSERWDTLARLEQSYRRRLAREKLEDPGDFMKKIVDTPAAFFPWERLIFAGVPDFPPWIATLAQNLVRDRSVEVWIHADAGEEDRFDEWGRPRVENEDWSIPLPDDNIHLCQDAGEAIREAVELATTRTQAPWPCLLGIGDPSSAATVRLELEERDIPAFDPSGTGFEETEGGRFIHLLCEYARGTEPEKLGAWLLDPIVGRWLRQRNPDAFREKWIQDFDHVMEEAIPSDIDRFFATAPAHSAEKSVFGTVKQQRQTASKAPNLFALFEEPSFQPLLAEAAKADGVSDFAEKLLTLREELERTGRAEPDFETSRLLIRECATFPLYEEHRQEDALQILGWLELLWEDHPWLLLPDFLDGSVPSAPSPHPLLPESLREALGLGNRRQREFRDAYILRSLVKQRESKGRVDVFVPNRNLNGEVRAPSRLLYLVPRKQLPQRVTYLSRDAETPAAGETAKPLTLHPTQTGKDWLEGRDSISVTSFAAWLRCPFTFYLERVCKLKPVETGQLEMDAPHFGTALHEVLSLLDTDPDSVCLHDEEALCDAMKGHLDGWFRQQYGERPNALLLLQKEGLQRRLQEACRLKAQARSEGWVPLHVEWDFRQDVPLSVEEIPLSGRMDLVEMRGDDAEIRLIDYKTSDSPTAPEKDHWQNIGRGTVFSPSNLFPLDNDPKRAWNNLQLPLYAAVLRQKYPKASIQIGYGLLPKALSESTFQFWEGFQTEYADEALRVAGRIVQLWRENAFWPPTRNFERSDFQAMAGPEGLAAWDHSSFKNLEDPEDPEDATARQP